MSGRRSLLPVLMALHLAGCGFFAPGLMAGLGSAASAGLNPQSSELSFDDARIGDLPAGWKAGATRGTGKPAQWSIEKDPAAPSGDQALAVKINDYGRGTFNLCWTDELHFSNGLVEVKVRARQGSIDQGGGPIWRVKDSNNYYIARWNPLEDNFRLYYVKAGRRVQLGSADVSVARNQWQTITIQHQGNRITGYLNGEKLLDVSDSTFPEAGGVGLWTKADAASSFDDLKVQKQP